MTAESFFNFYNSLSDLVKTFGSNGNLLRVEKDPESNIIKIIGENVSPLDKAKFGLVDISELAYDTAEHHPYWGLLYHCSQIAQSAIEKWNGQLSQREIDEINWSVDELKNICYKLNSHLENYDTGKDK